MPVLQNLMLQLDFLSGNLGYTVQRVSQSQKVVLTLN